MYFSMIFFRTFSCQDLAREVDLYCFPPPMRPGGWVYAGLRRLLHLLRIPVHAEVMSGISYKRMASLDVFVATHTAAMGMEPQPMTRWNASNEVTGGIRYFPKQDHWWHLPVWRSEGQYEDGNIMDYQVDMSMAPHVQGVLAVYEAHARAGDEATRMRIATMLRQIPEVLPRGPGMPALRLMRGPGGIRPAGDRRMLEDEQRNPRSTL